jgi:hypothetical protein
MSGIENASSFPSNSGAVNNNTQNFYETAPPSVENGLDSELASYLSSDTKTWVEKNAAKISKKSSNEAGVNTYSTPGLTFEGENITVNLSEANFKIELGTEYADSNAVKATADYNREKHITTASVSYKGENEFNISAKYNHGDHELMEGSVSFKDENSIKYAANYTRNGENNDFGGSLQGQPTDNSSVISFFNDIGKDYEAGMTFESKLPDGKSSMSMTGKVSGIDEKSVVKADAEIYLTDNIIAKADANYNGELSCNVKLSYERKF